jgi:hypothetical protein
MVAEDGVSRECTFYSDTAQLTYIRIELQQNMRYNKSSIPLNETEK